MTDQASEMKQPSPQQMDDHSLFHSRVVAITSGKGGIGKTNVVGGLAMSLAKMGQRVVLLDADFGLANLDILLGLSPKFTIEHVIRGERVLEEIIVEGPDGIRLIPATSGIQELTRMDASAELRLIQGLQRVAVSADWLLIDTGAGIHDSVIKLLMAAQEIVLVSTPEPTSLVDAYAMIKVVHIRDHAKPIWLLVNNAQSQEEAEETLEQIQAASQRFLSRDVNNLGMIPTDNHILQAVRQQQGVVGLYPDCPASKAFEHISRRLMEKVPLKKDGFNAFWKELSQG
jgi:flagellar biosynthesis protein FlhG